MPNIQVHNPQTFSDFMTIVEGFQEKQNTAWYRGSGKASHSLLPTLFRHPQKKNANELHSLEKEISSTFAQRSPPFVKQSFQDEWEQMFYMQHYGIPTRLLDWTESPFIALYFCLTSVERKKNNKISEDPAVWMLNPTEWNRWALRDITYKGGILDSRREQVKGYSPKADIDEMKNLPVMIFGTHNSARIVAQRGMFALFGKGMSPMDEVYGDDGDADAAMLQKNHYR